MENSEVMKLWKSYEVMKSYKSYWSYLHPQKYVLFPGFFKIHLVIFGNQFFILVLTLLILVFNLVDFVFNLVEFIFRRPKQFCNSVSSCWISVSKMLYFIFKHVVFHFQHVVFHVQNRDITFHVQSIYIGVWGGRLWSRVPARVLSPRLGDPTEGPVLG